MDTLQCKITEEAEKECQKLRMGQVAFSPALQEVNYKISVYILLKKRSEGLRVSSRLLSRSLCKAKFSTDYYALDSKTLHNRLMDAYSEYYTIKKLHISL